MITQEKISSENFRIFYSTELERFVLACMMTESAWYERYFSVSEEEYNAFENCYEQLSRIADGCFILGTVSPRFLGSQKIFENRTERQQKFAKSITAEINQNNKKLSEGI